MEIRSVDAINLGNFYLKRFGFGKTLIESAPKKDLQLIVTIPAFAEPNLQKSVKSILDCEAPNCSFEVIILINQSESASEEVTELNQKCIDETKRFLNSINNPQNVFLLEDFELPKKHAGVGLARKILMDEAVRRFEQIENQQGVIICFDADSEVSPNYLVAIENYFKSNLNIQAAGVHFEHPFENLDVNSRARNAIVEYELHLRYYIQALKLAKHPFAFHTIGSSMVVRSKTYQACGGMNKRKAGEDFYFLQKIIPEGNFGEIFNANVFPSPRESFRVPFGTGKAVGDYLNNQVSEFETYNLEIFKVLKNLFQNQEKFFGLSLANFKEFLKVNVSEIYHFFEQENLWIGFVEVTKNTKTLESFSKRFFKWLNAFMALKMVHYLEKKYPKQTISKEAKSLLVLNNYSEVKDLNNEGLLIKYRLWDKKNPL